MTLTRRLILQVAGYSFFIPLLGAMIWMVHTLHDSTIETAKVVAQSANVAKALSRENTLAIKRDTYVIVRVCSILQRHDGAINRWLNARDAENRAYVAVRGRVVPLLKAHLDRYRAIDQRFLKEFSTASVFCATSLHRKE